MTFNIKYLSENLFGNFKVHDEEWTINNFTLSFTGLTRKYEKQFRDEYFNNSIKPFRFSIILGAIFYSAFAFLDIILFPELKNIFFIIRFGIMVPVLIIVFLLSYTHFFKTKMQPIASVTMFITSLGIIAMVILTSQVAKDYSYYAGIILILFFGYSFTKIRFIYSFIAGLLIIISYEIGTIWISHTPTKVLINNNFFFISTNIIGMLISYYLEFQSRWNFYLTVLLQKERIKVIESNNRLEDRVRKRTQELTVVNKELQKEIAIKIKSQTEKSKIEAQLFQVQKMETIGTLAGGIAHDFNNILTPIIGYAGMALEELPPDSHLKEDIEQINNAASRGKSIIQQILTFSRQIDVDKKSLLLHNVINEVIDLLKVTTPSNIKVRKALDPECGSIIANKTQMHQVIMNLAVNSFYAMKESGGILDIKLTKEYIYKTQLKPYKNLKEGNYVVLTVADTGHGMNKYTMDRIFEPFFTNKDVGEGTGLGLSVVHGIIKNHNGFITVDSESGKGTTFRIYLPQHDERERNMDDK
jgi:signal transduction histidine kinase